MSYIELGTRRKTGTPDMTGNNTGNWTVSFLPEDIHSRVPYFEVYKVVISGAPGSTMNWYVDTKIWETTVAADVNAWDPAQALLMIPGRNLYFYWSNPSTDGNPPTVTIWMRYDPGIEANQAMMGVA